MKFSFLTSILPLPLKKEYHKEKFYHFVKNQLFKTIVTDKLTESFLHQFDDEIKLIKLSYNGDLLIVVTENRNVYIYNTINNEIISQFIYDQDIKKVYFSDNDDYFILYTDSNNYQIFDLELNQISVNEEYNFFMEDILLINGNLTYKRNNLCVVDDNILYYIKENNVTNIYINNQLILELNDYNVKQLCLFDEDNIIINTVGGYILKYSFSSRKLSDIEIELETKTDQFDNKVNYISSDCSYLITDMLNLYIIND